MFVISNLKLYLPDMHVKEYPTPSFPNDELLCTAPGYFYKKNSCIHNHPLQTDFQII